METHDEYQELVTDQIEKGVEALSHKKHHYNNRNNHHYDDCSSGSDGEGGCLIILGIIFVMFAMTTCSGQEIVNEQMLQHRLQAQAQAQAEYDAIHHAPLY